MTSFKDNRKKFDQEIRQAERLANSYILVGFQEGTITHSQVKNGRTKKAGLNMAQIAAANEFGTKTIPSRPFLRPAIDENATKITRAITGQYNKIMDQESTIENSLGLIGVLVENLIKRKIRSIYTPPNSPQTIARKKSSKPLIDFGQMVQSVRRKVVLG